MGLADDELVFIPAVRPPEGWVDLDLDGSSLSDVRLYLVVFSRLKVEG